MSDRSLRDDAHGEQLSLHVGGEEQLFDRADRIDRPTELVVAPVELHRRNVQRRLREAAAPKDAFQSDDPGGVSHTVLTAAGNRPDALGRIDRLERIRSLLEEFPTLPPGIRSDDPQYVEQIRTERSDNQLPPRACRGVAGRDRWPRRTDRRRHCGGT